jgi:isocitrate dehydrogenase
LEPTVSTYTKLSPPTTGGKITVNADGSLHVPNDPVIPFIEGDGIGADITRAALQYSAEKLQLELSPTHEDRLMNEYRHLSAFPENREVLVDLVASGRVRA